MDTILSMGQTGIRRVQQRDDRTSVFAQYTILCDDREAMQDKLQAAGIPKVVHYPVPLNDQTAYKHLCGQGCTPVADRVAKQVLNPLCILTCKLMIKKLSQNHPNLLNFNGVRYI